MKLTVNREDIISPLQLISGVVERKQTMPVLSNILMILENNQLTLTGTNMEVELVCKIDGIEMTSAGAVTVPARKLTDICRSLPENAVIELYLENEKIHLRSGKSHFTLTTLPAEHFPNIEEDEQELTVSFLQKDFKRMLDATAYAMAQQDVRYYLNGLLLELGNEYIRAVATDGHRLAVSTLSTELELATERQIVVPRRGILEFSKLLSDTDNTLQVSLSNNHIRSHIGNFIFTSKLIEGKFPDYNRVIPRGGDKVVIADRLALKAMFIRASILSNENIRGVRFQLSNGLLQVFANNPEHEQAEDSLEVSYQGEDLQIGFNVSYLIDVMNVIDDDVVKITLSNPNASALIESTSGDKQDLYVVMPMRL
jgi:DNA polymerase-3 subunit beta